MMPPTMLSQLRTCRPEDRLAFPTGKPKIEQVVLRGVLSAVHGYPYDDGSLEDHGLKLGSW
jgi:hypothetical protein